MRRSVIRIDISMASSSAGCVNSPASGFEFKNQIIPGAIPKEFIQAVEQGLREAATEGVPSGCPVEDVRVELDDGSYHDVDSSETAFRLAAAMAFQEAVKHAGPIVDSFDDDHASFVTEPCHPKPVPRDSAIELPEPDGAIEDDSDLSR
jgi:translation elongation factor EF-G